MEEPTARHAAAITTPSPANGSPAPLSLPIWITQKIDRNGLTAYTKGMNLLAQPWDRALSQATYDAYMLAVIDADPADYGQAVQLLLGSDLRAFPTPYQLRTAIERCRLTREMRARADSQPVPEDLAERGRQRAQLWQGVLAGLGATHADQHWWRWQAVANHLPTGLRDGLFVPPARDRHAALFVRAQDDANRWAMRWRARARTDIELAMGMRYRRPHRTIAVVALPDVLDLLLGAPAQRLPARVG